MCNNIKAFSDNGIINDFNNFDFYVDILLIIGTNNPVVLPNGANLSAGNKLLYVVGFKKSTTDCS